MKFAKPLPILGIISLFSLVAIMIARQPKNQNPSGSTETKISNRETIARYPQSIESTDIRFRTIQRSAVTDPLFENHERWDPTLRARLSKNFSGPKTKVASTDLENLIQEVKSESWLDPEDKAIRRRIRVVDTNFKYPNLRLEEDVVWNAKTTQFESTLRAASVADHLMVMPVAGQNAQAVMDELESQGFQVRSESSDIILVEISNSIDAIAQMDAIDKLEALDTFIDFAEPDYLVFPCLAPNDPNYASAQQWSLHNTVDHSTSTADADIDAEEAWAIRTSASNITVAVLDTGVRYTHEDLANQMWQNVSGDYGWDAYDEDTDPMDTDGHGTHCAGIVGAQGNNGVGISGVAWDVDIMAVRFIGQFGGTTSDAIRSMNFARENGADIISASWGGSGYSRGLLAAIQACYAADIPVVTAAGNERWDVDAKPQYPASYPTPNIVTVAATTRTDELTTFSNYGYTAIDLAAPGENILSCGISSDSDYRFLSGTSAATPHVAGALALARAHHGAESVDKLITRLLRSVDRLDSLTDKVAYEGRLNLHQLLLSSTTGYSHDFFNTPLVFKYCSGYWCRKNGDLTREPDEDTYSPNTGSRSAWFRWTALGDGLLRFTATGYQGGDISLVAFEGTVRNDLRRLKDNFSSRPTDQEEPSTVYIYVEKDKTYTFSVDSRSSANQVIAGSFNFTPGNDMRSQATQIPTGTSFEVEGNNCSATVESFEYQLQGHPFLPRHSVWWKWTPSVSGDYVISTYGSNFDTVLGLYEADSGMQSMGTNDSRSLTDDTSRLELTLQAGQEYYILVASYGRDTVGDISLAAFPKEDIRFLQDPESQLVRYGDSLELSVVTDTSSEATYEWFGPQGALGGVGNGPRILIPAAGANDMGDYYVVVRDGEATGTSATATITELALPPRFLFSPQDISVLDGTDIQMFAKADGLQPVSLKWFKEGVQVQTGNLHTIVSSSPSDSGIYYVEASNSVGTTRSHPFQILVSTDTFGPFIYRSPGLPGDLLGSRYINGRHMAFGLNGRLILSTNGINWDTPTLPEPMDINDVAYDASLGLYVIVGEERSSSNAASAVSLNGRNWTINPAPLPDWSLLEKVVAGNGIFVGYSTWAANKVYTTTNGVDWTTREYTTTGSETSKYLQNIEYYNGEFIGGGRGMIYRSSDGINWTENTTPNDGRILAHDGKLATFTGSPVGISTSTDGITWSAPVQCVNPPANLTRITSNGSRFYQVVGTTVSSSADGITWYQLEYDLLPSNPYASTVNLTSFTGPEGNLVAIGTSGVVQGPDYAHLASVNTQNLQTLPLITQIFGNTVYQLDDKGYTFYYSNDFRNWRSHTLSLEIEGDSLIYANGNYWALNIPTPTSTSYLMSGSSPAALTRHAEGTHNSSIKILRSWNDEVYAINNDQVFKLDINSNWQVVYTMPKVNNSLEIIRGMKTIDRGIMVWSDYGAVYATTNGTTWERVAYNNNAGPIVVDIQHPTLKPRYAGPSFCEFDGKAYLYVSGTNKLYAASTGFDFVEQANLNPFARLTAVPEGLLGIEGTTGWYSPDGTTWQQFPIHYLTDFFYHYNGTLLASTQFGIYQAGAPTSSPPENTAGNMVKLQSITTGSLFDLEYSVLDPEGRFDRVEFYANGVLIGQSTSTSGTQTIDVNWAGQRVVEMRSYDQDGQVSSDFWYLQGITSQPDMVAFAPNITSGRFKYSVWDNRLQAGLGQEMFSKIGDEWMVRGVPFNASNADFVTTPDAVFAIGAGLATARNYLISEDGIEWRDMNQPADAMTYQDEWLIGKNLGISRDGVSWINAGGTLGAAAGNGTIATLNGFGATTAKVSNDGSNWTTHKSLSIQELRFEEGYYIGTGSTIFHRSTDGRTWTDKTPALVSGETIQYLDVAGGWFYLITKNVNTWYLWISQDSGATWTKFTNPPPKAKQVSYGNGMWFCTALDGLYTSKDGLNWELSISPTQISNGSLPFSLNRGAQFLAHEDGVSTLMNNELYTTTDGFDWFKEIKPEATTVPLMLTEPITIDGSTKFTKLQSKPFISPDGTNWFECPFVPATGKSVRHVTIFNDKLLIYSGASNQAHDLWESSDGINFNQVTLNGSYYFSAIKYDGSRMFAKGDIVGGAFNQFFTSSDGANWTQLTTPAYFNSTIELLNGTLITLDTSNQKIHHSTDGITWQSTNLKISNLTYGNGLFLASQSSTMWSGATLDSLSTVTSNQSPYLGKFAFADGLFFLKTTSGIWSSADGETWQQLYSNLTGNLDVIRDTIYLNDNSSLRPLFAADLQVTAVTGTPGNLAIGANINATLSVKNVGNAIVPAGTIIAVHGVLTRDGLHGNDDDIPTGTDEITLGSDLAIGGTADLNVAFRVPGLRAGGAFRLVLTADPEVPELSRANNSDMTDSTLVTVSEFVLNITRNGNGNVNRDVSALRYANGTLVTLSANAGKGSGFGGWTGGNVSPLSSITLMMNQDKNLTANFVANVTLNLAIQGSGTVDGWEIPGNYLVGGSASLTAQPSAGWEFASWAGGSTSTNASLSLTVNQNTNLTAIFRQTLSGWKGEKFTVADLADPLISGDLVDADLDGVPNWREYLHGSNPKDSRSKGVEQAEIGGGFLQMIYTRNQGAEAPYALTCEASRDLSAWNDPDFEERVLSVADGIETIEARIPADSSNTKGFIHLKYVKP